MEIDPSVVAQVVLGLAVALIIVLVLGKIAMTNAVVIPEQKPEPIPSKPHELLNPEPKEAYSEEERILINFLKDLLANKEDISWNVEKVRDHQFCARWNCTFKGTLVSIGWCGHEAKHDNEVYIAGSLFYEPNPFGGGYGELRGVYSELRNLSSELMHKHFKSVELRSKQNISRSIKNS